MFLLRKSLRFALFILLLIFITSPFFGGWLLKSEWFEVGRIFSNLGFYWLGFFFVFSSISALLIFSAYLQGVTSERRKSALWIYSRKTLITTLALAFSLNIYGFFEASNIGVTRLNLANPEMPKNAAPIRIVQISDAHYSLTMLPSQHKRMLELVRSLNPDIIVATGDFLDRGAGHVGKYMDLWRLLQPRLGKYAVLGNHEAIAGLSQSLALLNRSGFKVLRGELVDFGSFRLAGIDDPFINKSDNLHFSPENLKGTRGLSILLTHRPGWQPQLDGRFDLALSGHTHGGQIFPFGFVVQFIHGSPSGLGVTSWGGWSYNSRGAGTWGPPIRILAAPEVTLLVMHPGKKKQIEKRTF